MSRLFYVYYDNKTKSILSINSEKNSDYEDAIEVKFEDVENFLNGKWHIKDFKVDYLVGSSNLQIISISDQRFNFDSNEFRHIEESDDYAEFIVEWNAIKKSWSFRIDEAYKKTSTGIYNSRLTFFITLELDFDFLIRTITVETNNLMNWYDFEVPFITDIEHDITRISIASKMNFKNYALRIINE